ncbi:glycosyltransferase [Zavarzinella formosa]|uniref:glycosyltransferase n=1 Tax=Zavarzinella formosa TaxID=360055 RepID=UPI00031E0C20|nr:glycosyltransferase [Zavarzinella formosa]
MHVLFVHQNFPAQFGHVAGHLIQRHGYRCSFVTEKRAGVVSGIECIQYKVVGGATEQNHYCTRTFENSTRHAFAVHEALKARPDIKPDLIVGHSGFGSTLFLKELYPDVPIINYFEYFYRTRQSDMDFRKDFPSQPIDALRARARNATLLLDLENCNVGYSPTKFQKSLFPAEFQPKVRQIFDGVDTSIWKPMPNLPRVINGRAIPDELKVITYATRGMESMRGFDIFMKAAKKICDRRKDVIFLIAGQDRVCYGGDAKFTGGKTFKEWVFSQDSYDESRFVFLGLIPPPELAKLFNITDVHFYLTVPFVLSWSLVDAMACGATILASDTAPVREMIRHGENGILTDFFDVEAFAEYAIQLLDRRDEYRILGETASRQIREAYSVDVCLPQMVDLYEETVNGAKSS